MVKSLIVLVNFVVFAVLNLFLLQRIEIEHTVPETLGPGSSAEVSITIDKGKVGGFAKLQINVDEGLVIENIESLGASFTFKDQKAKFIWMSLPEDKEFTVRYLLKANSDASGSLEMTGHFSYIDENQRLVYDIAPKTIQTGVSTSPVAASDSQENASALAVVKRNMVEQDEGRYRVTLELEKHNLEGFAKLQEIISRDYTAVAVESADAVFNIVDNKVKFVWFDIPTDENLTLVYDLIPVTGNPEEFDITGEFSFLVNNETQVVQVNAPAQDVVAETVDPDVEEPEVSDEIIAMEDEPVEEELPEPEQVEDESTMTDEPEATEEEAIVEVEESGERDWESDQLEGELRDEEPEVVEAIEEVIEDQEVSADIPNEEEIEDIPEEEETPETSSEPEPIEEVTASTGQVVIDYRVQITAAHKLVDAAYFQERHNFNGNFTVENHEGWIKYTTGGFDLYRAARDHRDALMKSYNFPGPFVTAYNEGERITVQEALMIANQKWVP